MSDHIHYTNHGLKLDWGPLLAAYRIRDGVLLHWQAMPRPNPGADDRRNFGALVVEQGDSRYVTVPHAHWDCEHLGPCKLVQINQAYPRQVPTAAMWWPDAKLEHKEGRYRLI